MTMNCAVKRDPFSNLQADFNRLFGGGFPAFFEKVEEGLGGRWAPSVDIYEDQNSIVLEADLPGVKAEDFKLSIENYRLTLSGERKFEQEGKGEGWQRVERNYGSFSRAFTLPNTVNVEEVKAEFKDGVLRITLPKREEVKAREIKIDVKTEGNGARA